MAMFKRSTAMRRLRLDADKRRDDAAGAGCGPPAAGEVIPDRLSLEQVAEFHRRAERELREPLQTFGGDPIDGNTATTMWVMAEHHRLMAEAVERITKRDR